MTFNEKQYTEDLESIRELLAYVRRNADDLGVTIEFALQLRISGVLNSIASILQRTRPVLTPETLKLWEEFMASANKQMRDELDGEWKP